MATVTMMDEEMGDSPRTPEGGRSEIDVQRFRSMQIGVASQPAMESPLSATKSKKVKRNLFPKEIKSHDPWSVEETKSLVLFIMLYSDGKAWMTHKDFNFWNEAGGFIQRRVHTPYKRSGIIKR